MMISPDYGFVMVEREWVLMGINILILAKQVLFINVQKLWYLVFCISMEQNVLFISASIIVYYHTENKD